MAQRRMAFGVYMWISEEMLAAYRRDDFESHFAAAVAAKGGTDPELKTIEAASNEQLEWMRIEPRVGERLVRLYGRAMPPKGVDVDGYVIHD